jgi:hypothetical protein
VPVLAANRFRTIYIVFLCLQANSVTVYSFPVTTARLSSSSTPLYPIILTDFVFEDHQNINVHESMPRDIIMNTTNEMQLYTLIYYS